MELRIHLGPWLLSLTHDARCPGQYQWNASQSSTAITELSFNLGGLTGLADAAWEVRSRRFSTVYGPRSVAAGTGDPPRPGGLQQLAQAAAHDRYRRAVGRTVAERLL